MSALHFDGGTLELKLPFLADLQLRWQDLLDIVLLTLIFYRLLILIKGTRTIPMLMGFSLLLALYVVALLLDLNATQLLLDNLGSSLVLVMVVLFQADIRNALAQFGLITLFRDTGLQRKNVVDSVLQSCIIMARQRVGALIVFEQDVGLRNYSERGVQINATVSEELVQSIFHPTSPLHDGAVILNRKGELVAARCILPVSMNSRLDQDLGTRHRAAIGLTEETDAVVLVVSEERKEISLSYKGQLLRGANENIREALIQVLEGKVPETLQKKPEAEKDEIDENEEPSSQSGNDASRPQTQSPVT